MSKNRKLTPTGCYGKPLSGYKRHVRRCLADWRVQSARQSLSQEGILAEKWSFGRNVVILPKKWSFWPKMWLFCRKSGHFGRNSGHLAEIVVILAEIVVISGPNWEILAQYSGYSGPIQWFPGQYSGFLGPE